MASSSSPSNSLSSEPAIIEQVITEFFTKSIHIILESRSPFVSSRNFAAGDHFPPSPSPSSSSTSSSGGRPRDKWFNLALRDCPAALENFDLWRQSNLDPLILDIILLRRPPSDEKLLERWILQYEPRKPQPLSKVRSSGASSHSSEFPALYKKTYKKSIVLLRSLYLTVRLLPAYKVFQALNSSGQIRPFSLSHRISSFVEPFTRAEDAEMSQFSFAPVDTPCGRLTLSVSYLPAIEDVSSEPPMPLSAQFIADYVGSPMTDPFKRLPQSGGQVPPAHVSFTRRHSWSNERRGTPSVSPSPSPTYSDSRALRSNLNPCMPFAAHEIVTHRDNASFDEYWPSPPFSPSPSPPTRGHLLNAPLRTESAPVSIPSFRLGKSSGLRTQGLPPSPSRKAAKPVCSDVLRAQVTAAYASRTSSPESNLRIRKETPRFLEYQTSLPLQKVLSFGRDDVANLSGVSFSRSPSRLTLLDEIDDPEGAFAIDDEDLTDSCHRTGYSDVKSHESGISESSGLLLTRRSPEAAVGALVRMLKKAPPLRQDLSNSVRTLQALRDEICNERIQYDKGLEDGIQKLDNVASSLESSDSGLSKSKTAADALTELRHYKKMKELLLRQGGLQSSDALCAEKFADEGP